MSRDSLMLYKKNIRRFDENWLRVAAEPDSKQFSLEDNNILQLVPKKVTM